MKIIEKNFESWNEEMVRKYNPENYHKNPNFIIRFIENKRVKGIINFLTLGHSDRIIDLGCGAGNIMERIKIGGELTGVDLSDYLLGLAKKKSYFVPVKFVRSNIENLPKEITDFKFDKIYCSEVLEHLETPQNALKEIKKIAKKDSIIVISIPNEKLINKIKKILQKLKIFDLFFPNISKKMDDEWHLYSFDLAKLEKMLKYDYIIEKTKGIPFGILPLRYVIKAKINESKENI